MAGSLKDLSLFFVGRLRQFFLANNFRFSWWMNLSMVNSPD
jgi:hypothetical protein